MILGKQSIKFDNPPHIIGFASIVGPKEGEGPLGQYFDLILDDVLYGADNWEQAESKLQKEAARMAVESAGITMDKIRYIYAGDLLGQLIATSFGIMDYNIPMFGLYGACSTMGESISLASMSIAGGFADYALALTSSHFCGAEKEFRYPLEFGSQRALTASWTVTGSGAVVLATSGGKVCVRGITPGRIVDYGVKDSMNMGAAMAPAAADTLYNHFVDFNSKPEDYDLIITGDLGIIGKTLVKDMLYQKGYLLDKNFTDCGIEIFSANTQDTHAGGSGCGCAAVTLTGYILKKMIAGELNKVLIIPTGALLSTVSFNQGENVPGIAHAVLLERCN